MTGTGTSGQFLSAPVSEAEGYEVVSKSLMQVFFTYSFLACLGDSFLMRLCMTLHLKDSAVSLVSPALQIPFCVTVFP